MQIRVGLSSIRKISRPGNTETGSGSPSRMNLDTIACTNTYTARPDSKASKNGLILLIKSPIGEYQKIEWQAGEFAGQFLMPLDKLRDRMNEHIAEAERQGYNPLNEKAILDFITRGLRRDFGVSPAAIQTRLRRSKLWPPAPN